MIPHIDDVVGPPVVGKWYMVPAIFMNRLFGHDELWWPVTGPMHTDAELFDFPWPHYHVDARFLTRRHVGKDGNMFTDDPYAAALSHPISKPFEYMKGKTGPFDGPPAPVPRKFQCRRTGVDYPYLGTKQVVALNKLHKEDRVRVNADGHMICPHRGARIDQIVPDADGIVTCPLHGLRINVKTGECGV